MRSGGAPFSLIFLCFFMHLSFASLYEKDTKEKSAVGKAVIIFPFFHQNTSFNQCRSEKPSVNAGGQKSQKSIWIGFLSVS